MPEIFIYKSGKETRFIYQNGKVAFGYQEHRLQSHRPRNVTNEQQPAPTESPGTINAGSINQQNNEAGLTSEREPEKSFICPICQGSFQTQNLFMLHVMKHRNPENAADPPRDRRTSADDRRNLPENLAEVEQHQKEVHDFEHVQCSEDGCDLQFKSIRFIRLHFKEFHEKRIFCPICMRVSFRDKNKVAKCLRRHFDKCLRGSTRAFVTCQSCDIRLSKNELQTHKDEEHEEYILSVTNPKTEVLPRIDAGIVL